MNGAAAWSRAVPDWLRTFAVALVVFHPVL